MGMVSDGTCKSVLVTLTPDTKSLAQVGHTVGFAEQPSSICKAPGEVKKSNYQGSQWLLEVVPAIVALSTSLQCVPCASRAGERSSCHLNGIYWCETNFGT